MASIVFKVKYGETLRRFNVSINGDQCLDLSMEGLKLKMFSLFNLQSDAEFHLIYKDEDDDLVTLVDDDDLNDVVKQGLDPVRITVHLNAVQSARSSSAPSSGSVAPHTPIPQKMHPIETCQYPINGKSSILNPQQSSSTDATKIMKSIHDHMRQTYRNSALPNSGATSVNRCVEVGNDSKHNSDDLKYDGPPADDIDRMSRVNGVGVFVKPPLCSSIAFGKAKNGDCASSTNKMSESGGMKKNKDVSAREKDASKTESVRDALEILNKTGLKSMEPVPLCDQVFQSRFDQFPKQIQSSNRSVNNLHIVHYGITCDGCDIGPITGPRFKSKVRYDYDLCSNCFSEMGNDADYTRMDLPLKYNNSRSFKAPAVPSSFPVVHKGVRCDGCRVLPIIGQRFKSKVKHDYDLCGNCFPQIGNDTDYTRIDPMTYILPQAPDATPCPYTNQRLLKKLRARLDSCFIKDINVMDGTTMPPSTPFEKIWRIRNNGTLPWKRGLQLLWIGGDRFRNSDSITIQVPSSGVYVGSELNIAVDFIAPELPGQYISYWRMADSCGHKFGQRVWVQIQVSHSLDLTRESSPVLNLNLPPPSNETAFPQVLDVKIEPRFGSFLVPSILDQNHKIQMSSLDLPINNDFLVSGDMEYPSSGLAVSPVPPPATSSDRPGSPVAPTPDSYPEDSPQIPEAVAPLVSYPNADYKFGESSTSPSNLQVDNSTSDKNINLEQSDQTKGEEKLLKELEHMGFNQIDLNKEFPPANEDELEQSEHSEEDLCDVADWDPILEELKEMGFEDKDTNQKLLAKNNGSISRVVMDLIAEENP